MAPWSSSERSSFRLKQDTRRKEGRAAESSAEGELVDKEKYVEADEEHLGLWMKSSSSLLSPLIS